MDAAIATYRRLESASPNKKPSVRAVAKEFDVNHVTLGRRLSGASRSREEAHIDAQALTPEEELCIVDWIARMGQIGFPPSSAMVTETAEHLRDSRPHMDPTPLPPLPPLSDKWIQRFRGRHPEVSSVISRSMQPKRIKASTHEAVSNWFAAFRAIMEKNKYHLGNVWNMDETGYSMGKTQNGRVNVVVSHGPDEAQTAKNRSWKGQVPKASGRGEWQTFIEAVSADGATIPPFIIFKSAANPPKVCADWMPTGVDIAGAAFQALSSGWTSNELCYTWLRDHFIPLTQPDDPHERRLLLLDGHGSHVQPRFIACCIFDSIDVLILPPHTSQYTQPLDVTIFGPLKQAMSARTTRHLAKTRGYINKAHQTFRAFKSQEVAITPANIRAGFKSAGLVPFRPSIVLARLPAAVSKTPKAAQSPRRPLETIRTENREFMEQHREILRTPVKNRLLQATSSWERVEAENRMMQRELEELRELVGPRKGKKRKAVNVEQVGTHEFSSAQGFRRVIELSPSKKPKKDKGKARASPEDSPEPPEGFTVFQDEP